MIDYLGFRNKDLEFVGKFLHFEGISRAPPCIHIKHLTGPPTPLPLLQPLGLDQLEALGLRGHGALSPELCTRSRLCWVAHREASESVRRWKPLLFHEIEKSIAKASFSRAHSSNRYCSLEDNE